MKSTIGSSLGISSDKDDGPTSQSDRNETTNCDGTDKAKAQSTGVSRKPRRKARYETQDLLREKSPTLDEDGLGQNTNNPANSQIDAPNNTTISNGGVYGPRKVQCNICKRLMMESKLAYHIRLMHLEKTDSNQTDQTKKTTKVKNEHEDIATSKSETISRPFRCEHCGKSYAIKYTWQQHVKTHIEGRPKCPECGDTFATPFGLYRHRVRNHNIEHNLKTFKCDQCSKDFFSTSELSLHQQRIHSEARDFVCPECQKTFAVKSNLRLHMRTHSREKLFKCDICLTSFAHPYSLVSHRRIHTNDLPFECEICNKRYRSKQQLSSHQNVHTENRPYKCDECPKTFRSRTAYKMHLDEHKGIKRFSCQYCSRKFQCHGNKVKHERRHQGIKSHKCDICSKAFIEKQELKNHHKVHEKRNQVSVTTALTATTTTSSISQSPMVNQAYVDDHDDDVDDDDDGEKEFLEQPQRQPPKRVLMHPDDRYGNC